MSATGEAAYREVLGWGGVSWAEDVTGVAVDARDRVYTLRRTDPQVIVLDPAGAVLGRWGHACFSSRPHMIAVAGERILIADDGAHQLFVFTSDGELVETIGSGQPSDTGYDLDNGTTPEEALGAMKGGSPFNRPTKAVVHENEIYVADGYRNCRVHRLSRERELVRSWGGAGAADGCFVVPHSVAVDSAGRIVVCDRENDRLQIFSPNGDHLASWTDLRRPTDVAFDRRGNAYVTELPRGPNDLKSWRLGRASLEFPARVTVFDPQGTIVARIGGEETGFAAPHAIAVDSTDAVYVAEIPEAFNRYSGRADRLEACLRKFVPRAEPGVELIEPEHQLKEPGHWQE